MKPVVIEERTTKIVWPSIGNTRLGRVVGQMCAVGSGSGRFLTWGKLLAVPAIPLALAAFVWNLLPYVARRYRLTNKRVVVEWFYSGKEERSVPLDAFDDIQVRTLPGQSWLRCGELVFTKESREVFRLSAVSRPEIFRHVCLEARHAYLSVYQVILQQQPAAKTA